MKKLVIMLIVVSCFTGFVFAEQIQIPGYGATKRIAHAKALVFFEFCEKFIGKPLEIDKKEYYQTTNNKWLCLFVIKGDEFLILDSCLRRVSGFGKNEGQALKNALKNLKKLEIKNNKRYKIINKKIKKYSNKKVWCCNLFIEPLNKKSLDNIFFKVSGTGKSRKHARISALKYLSKIQKKSGFKLKIKKEVYRIMHGKNWLCILCVKKDDAKRIYPFSVEIPGVGPTAQIAKTEALTLMRKIELQTGVKLKIVDEQYRKLHLNMWLCTLYVVPAKSFEGK